jgi:Family of unknown function (DUF6427)
MPFCKRKASQIFFFIFATMLQWFTGNRPIVLLLLPVLVGILVGLNLWSGYYEYAASTNLGIWGSEFKFPQWLTLSFGPLFALGNAILLNLLFNRNDFIDRNTYVTALIYIAYFGFYHAFYQLDGLSISHFLLILSLFEIFKLVQNEKGNKAVFNAGFLAGLACTFHPALLLFFPFLYFMVVALRPFLFREFILLCVGFGIPILYATLFSWFLNNPIDMRLLKTSTNYTKIQIDFLVTAGLVIFTVLLSFLSLNQQSQKTSIRAKKLMRALFLFSAFGLLLGSLDFFFFRQIERFSLLFIPISFFMSFGLLSKRFQALSGFLIYLILIYSIGKIFLAHSL